MLLKITLQLPSLPEIEIIKSAELELNVDTHFSLQKKKYGDFEFSVCKEGYIMSYIQAYAKNTEPKEVFYAVHFGRDHPL